MKKQLAICDGDEQYRQMMQAYLIKRLEGFEILTFEDLQQAAEYSRKQAFAIVLVSEALYSEDLQGIQAIHIYVLREDGTGDVTKHPYIEKYQSMEQLISSIFMDYSEEAFDLQRNMRKTDKIRYHVFYSPIRKEEQTKAALALGQVLAEKNKKVLYLNLQAFAGWEDSLRTGFYADITDLLYFARRKDNNLKFRFQSMKQTLSGVDYMAPAEDYMDLLLVTENEWISFFEKLSEMDEYNDFILDLSEACQGLYRLLERSDYIYSMQAVTDAQRNSINQYKRLLEKRELSSILEKTSWLEMPREYFERAVNMERLYTTQIGEYMKGLMLENGNRQIRKM